MADRKYADEGYDDDDLDIRKPRSGNSRIDRPTLRAIAIYQKVILLCILAYVTLFVGQFFVPAETKWVLGIFGLAVILTATVFVFLLSTKVYSVVAGVLLGLVTLVPCVGLIALLVINGKATSTLRAHGINVGLIGADLSQIDKT